MIINFENEEKLVSLCLELSRDSLLVQGAGGNFSVKEEDTLWIKASGTWLSDAGSEQIFLPISYQEVKKLVERQDFQALPTATNDSTLRPSIETWLHAIMPQKFVIHLHALDVLALLIHKESQSELKAAGLDGIGWGFVEYVKPGPDLAVSVATLLANQPTLEVLFLENHGIVVAADNIQHLNSLLERVRLSTGQKPVHSIIGEMPNNDIGFGYVPVADKDIHALATQPELVELVSKAWAISPDHVVFLGAQPELFSSVDDFQAEISVNNQSPLVVFISGIGVFSKGILDKAGQEQIRAYFELLIRQPQNQDFNNFSNEQIGELLNWDAEKYRLALRK